MVFKFGFGEPSEGSGNATAHAEEEQPEQPSIYDQDAEEVAADEVGLAQVVPPPPPAACRLLLRLFHWLIAPIPVLFRLRRASPLDLRRRWPSPQT